MQSSFPMRKFDPALLQEPNVYRTNEAIMHYAEAMKMLINEQVDAPCFSAALTLCAQPAWPTHTYFACPPHPLFAVRRRYHVGD